MNAALGVGFSQPLKASSLIIFFPPPVDAASKVLSSRQTVASEAQTRGLRVHSMVRLKVKVVTVRSNHVTVCLG